MNLTWNTQLRRFEAEFHDFQADLAAVKEAGFKTDGPPGWVWYSAKAEPLAKLKGRPGLTITPEARAEFTRLHEVELRNAQVKAELEIRKKELKKKLKADKQEAATETFELKIGEKGYIGKEDLPPATPSEKQYIPPPPPDMKCLVCQTPVYDYEYSPAGPVACMWCQKIVLDKNTVI